MIHEFIPEEATNALVKSFLSKQRESLASDLARSISEQDASNLASLICGYLEHIIEDVESFELSMPSRFSDHAKFGEDTANLTRKQTIIGSIERELRRLQCKLALNHHIFPQIEEILKEHGINPPNIILKRLKNAIVEHLAGDNEILQCYTAGAPGLHRINTPHPNFLGSDVHWSNRASSGVSMKF